MSASLGRFTAVVAALSAITGTAHAAPWSAPEDVGPAGGAPFTPTLAFAPNGNGLAGWNARTSPNQYPGTGRLLRLTKGDGFGEVRELPDALVAGPALDAQGR